MERIKFYHPPTSLSGKRTVAGVVDSDPGAFGLSMEVVNMCHCGNEWKCWVEVNDGAASITCANCGESYEVRRVC